MQDFVDVARRVSGRENYGGPFDRRVAEADPGDFSVPDSDVGYFRPEQHLSAGVDDRLSHRGDDARQPVGADVRVRVVQDRLVGAVEAENFERLAVVAAFFRAREELAVGIGARSAFAESVVRFRIYRAVAVDPGDVPFARRDVSSAFEYDRAQAAFDQPQRGEQSGRPRSDDDDRRATPDLRIIEAHRRRSLFSVDIDLYAEVDADLAAARVDRTANDAYQCDPGLRNGYPVGDQRQVTGLVGCLFRREFQRQFDGHNF